MSVRSGFGVRLAKWIVEVTAVLTVAGLLHALALVAISGRTRAPEERLVAARRAVEAARTGAAVQWAPEELRQASEALGEAEAEYTRQSRRPWPLRDFSIVGGRLWRAEVAARQALAQGEERLATARSEAVDAVEEVTQLLGGAQELIRATALPQDERVHLARARFIIAEAESLLRAREYLAATRRAGAGQLELEEALGPALARARRYTSVQQVRTWNRWVEETTSWSRTTGRTAVIVLKERNELRLLERGRTVRTYPVDIGSNALGRKLQAGDRATPEGRYRVVARKDRGRTRYHKALLLDYPNAADRRRHAEARRAGEIPWEAQPGALIEIHGDGGRGSNWTDGCVALSNEHMDEVFARVPVGSWVTIVGGDGENGTFSDLVVRLDGGGERR